MMDFALDKQLVDDSFFLEELVLCEVRLYNNANFPWLLLIPQRNHISEIFELSAADRLLLLDEINHMAEKLKKCTQCDKINIAALGNVVPQLHVHIIARFDHDTAWPKPVWGAPTIPYADKQHAVRYWQEKLNT